LFSSRICPAADRDTSRPVSWNDHVANDERRPNEISVDGDCPAHLAPPRPREARRARSPLARRTHRPAYLLPAQLPGLDPRFESPRPGEGTSPRA
jgi:hypothetical protein